MQSEDYKEVVEKLDYEAKAKVRDVASQFEKELEKALAESFAKVPHCGQLEELNLEGYVKYRGATEKVTISFGPKWNRNKVLVSGFVHYFITAKRYYLSALIKKFKDLL